jgi:O-antigen ligase
LSGIVFVLLAFSLNPRWGNKAVLYGKRGQSKAEFFALTGRTDIWRQVIRQIPEAPFTGHGYGISRFTLKPITWDFQAAHCHNEMLEALFSTGILGFIALLLLYIYNLKWLISFSRLKGIFSCDLALHASIVVVMFLVSALFEARIAVKLLPFQPLFFFYLIILDREKYFFNTKKLLEEQ